MPSIIVFLLVFLLLQGSQTQAQMIDPTSPTNLADTTFLSIPGPQWKIAFSDEFNVAKLDGAKWQPHMPWAGKEDHRWHVDGYASYMTEEDILLSGGQLHLTCRKMDIQGKTRTFHYTEGMVTTANTFRFKYGYAEVSAKAPMEAGPGLWPAFWTLADGWPPEFDIIELWTGEPRIHQGYCFARPDGKGQDWRSYHEKIGPRGFHTYGMEWGPGYVFFNVDGKITRRVFGDIVTDKPQYLLLNSAVCSGKGNIGPTDKTIFPNSFDVEYCRVYARPDAIAFHNAGFEDADHWPWTINKAAKMVEDHPHSGKKCMQISAPDGSAEQKIFGLHPETQYTLSIWARATDSQSLLQLSIKDQGAEETAVKVDSLQWKQHTLNFKTGEKQTTAIFRCASTSGQGGFIDDLSIQPAK